MASPSDNNPEFVARTEAALRASEALKTAILETALDAIVVIDHEGRILDFNPAAERMFGISRQEALHHEMAELIIPAQLRQRHRMGLTRAVASGQDTIVGQRIEITALRKCGEEFPVELAITRIRRNGEPPIFTGHIRDITARKRGELSRATQLAVTQVLAEAGTLAEATPRMLQAVCESLRWDLGTIWRVDPERAVLLCVDFWHAPELRLAEFEAATRQVAFARGVGLPGRIWETSAPCWIPDVVHDANFPRAPLASHEGLHGAFGFPIQLGGQVLGVIEFFSREIRQPDNELLEMFSTIGSQIGQFIERRRSGEEIRQLNAVLEKRVAVTARELGESEERFSKAFRASPVFMSIARLTGEFVEVNEAFLQSGGWTREEVVGHTSAELNLWAEPDDRRAFLDEFQKRGCARNREVVLRSKDGRRQTLLMSAELIDIDGHPHILAVSLNIDARKRAEEEMRRALEQERELSRLKTNFVTLVSHEFRTPLGIIMSGAEILQKYFDRLAPDRRAEHLQDIHNASRRMADLMDEVLLLARVEAGRCKPAPLDLRTFCSALVEQTGSSSEGAGSITLTARRLAGTALADKSLLRHIFTNLLSNAVKYSVLQGMVRFIVERRGREAVFKVCDRGIGIPPDDLAQLFQMFRRGANVGERVGSGLGLVIVKRCVELHGGKIQVESKEGVGTSVTVTLPLFGTAISNGQTTRKRKLRTGKTSRAAGSFAARKPKR